MSRDHFNYRTSIHGTLWPEEQFVENKNQCSILLFFYEASYCTSSKLIYNFGYNKRLFLSTGPVGQLAIKACYLVLVFEY